MAHLERAKGLSVLMASKEINRINPEEFHAGVEL
jgi:hypothetical protein